MAETVTRIAELTEKLEAIVGTTRVLRDDAVLERYGRDTSHGPPQKPDVVVLAQTTEEVQRTVQLANQYRIPVTPRSSGVGFYGAGIPEQGGIVIDMSHMKKIRRVDPRNRWALYEAGVTYGELQTELAQHGMRPIMPLLPHPEKSAITSCLEREPRLSTKHHLDETILTMEMVLPTGDLFHTGSMSVSAAPPEKIPEEAHSDLCNFMGPGIDWFRLIPGSLGTYGIVTVMNTKIAFIPTRQKVVFIGFKTLEQCVEPCYYILRKLIGDECFILNNRHMAEILAQDPDDIPSIAAKLPPFIVVLNLTADAWFPDEKIAYQEQALREASRIFQFIVLDHLPYVTDAAQTISRLLYQPWHNSEYWKFRAQGASKEIFFLTQLQRAPEFLTVVHERAAVHGYPRDAIGLYLQPKQNGRAFHMGVNFPYNPSDPDQQAWVEALFLDASKALVQHGAFFYRIYGPWADLVYSQTGNLHITLKRIKKILDPNMIMNPGKLGF
ncbi:MAG: FAD-binding oxidoreductase [Desulfobacterota bacterium]|nr:FAD-binding oxidoreductase [Thermodesulfobacteriota bacterium]